MREGTRPVTGRQGEFPACAQVPSSGAASGLPEGGVPAANPNPSEDCRLHGQ